MRQPVSEHSMIMMIVMVMMIMMMWMRMVMMMVMMWMRMVMMMSPPICNGLCLHIVGVHCYQWYRALFSGPTFLKQEKLWRHMGLSARIY